MSHLREQRRLPDAMSIAELKFKAGSVARLLMFVVKHSADSAPDPLNVRLDRIAAVVWTSFLRRRTLVRARQRRVFLTWIAKSWREVAHRISFRRLSVRSAGFFREKRVQQKMVWQPMCPAVHSVFLEGGFRKSEEVARYTVTGARDVTSEQTSTNSECTR